MFYLALQLLKMKDGLQKTHLLKSYKDVLKIWERPHRVAVYAPAGSGKTVFCRVMAYCFAKYGTLGEKYDLVVFLTLRSQSNEDDFKYMFINKLFPSECNRKHVCEKVHKVLENTKDRTLFILEATMSSLNLKRHGIQNMLLQNMSVCQLYCRKN